MDDERFCPRDEVTSRTISDLVELTTGESGCRFWVDSELTEASESSIG